MKKTSALILAAGLSTRMGQEKFALEFSPGLTFLEHIAAQYHQSDCHRIVVVLNPTGKQLLDKLPLRLPETVQVVINHNPERGRFSSINTGLKLLKDDDYVFLHNIDNPAISQELLIVLTENIRDADYVYPVFQNRGGHPILLSNTIVREIVGQENDDLILKNFLKRFKKAQVEFGDQIILTNINTREDYDNWKRSGQSLSASD